jgi:hypothetical protein
VNYAALSTIFRHILNRLIALGSVAMLAQYPDVIALVVALVVNRVQMVNLELDLTVWVEQLVTILAEALLVAVLFFDIFSSECSFQPFLAR